VHEDDALRALRAAAEMRDALPGLGVQARLGVNTGEIVTSGHGTLVTGDAVNVSARLEQAARPGEILIGAETAELAGVAAAVEELEPLELKGKVEPVAAFRLVSVGEAPRRAHGPRFVGREAELALLRATWSRASECSRCELVTIFGEPGVGKSRLVSELVDGLGVRTVFGGCLSYGEGITYWPVTEIVRALDERPEEPAAAAAIRSLLGESDAPTSADEIAWAFRKLLEQAAPLLVVFDDIQWGEETFLDLVEHISLCSTGAPLLIMCLARPELAERRPAWPVVLRVEPLPAAAVDQLMPATVPAGLRERIARFAGGNPLFVTEMVAMAAAGGEEVMVPATLKALLAARLDQLEAVERGVLERGAVEGELFHRRAVQALSSPETPVMPKLAALVRKELIRPERPQLPAEDGFRFRHLLIRDAAYDSLPKATRVDLHERFAAWLDSNVPELAERDEIVGYHLEQAYRYEAELGRPDSALAERAAARFAGAGRRAIDREDHQTAIALLARAAELVRPHRLDLALELELAWAWDAKDWREPVRIAEAVAERAEADGDESGAMLARAMALFARTTAGQRDATDEGEALLRAALPREERQGEPRRLALLWDMRFSTANFQMRNADSVAAAEQALHYHRLAGDSPSSGVLEFGLVFGPCPAEEALRRLDSLATPPSYGEGPRAVVLAMLGRIDEAWRLAEAASNHLREVAGDSDQRPNAFQCYVCLWLIAMIEGDRERAARYNAEIIPALDASLAATFRSLLARNLYYLGRHEEAEPLLRAAQAVPPSRASMRVMGPAADALLLIARGEGEQAETQVRQAVDAAETGTDSPWFTGWAYEDLATVLEHTGRTEDARDTMKRALAVWERKECLPCAERARERIESLAR
jgi:tetratricopeptide (TPR) repeat protein